MTDVIYDVMRKYDDFITYAYTSKEDLVQNGGLNIYPSNDTNRYYMGVEYKDSEEDNFNIYCIKAPSSGDGKDKVVATKKLSFKSESDIRTKSRELKDTLDAWFKQYFVPEGKEDRINNDDVSDSDVAVRVSIEYGHEFDKALKNNNIEEADRLIKRMATDIIYSYVNKHYDKIAADTKDRDDFIKDKYIVIKSKVNNRAIIIEYNSEIGFYIAVFPTCKDAHLAITESRDESITERQGASALVSDVVVCRVGFMDNSMENVTPMVTFSMKLGIAIACHLLDPM